MPHNVLQRFPSHAARDYLSNQTALRLLVEEVIRAEEKLSIRRTRRKANQGAGIDGGSGHLGVAKLLVGETQRLPQGAHLGWQDGITRFQGARRVRRHGGP